MAHGWLTNLAGNATSKVSGAPFPEWAIASFFGRVNYSYKNKYMATFIIRTDGSSNFARGNRWGIFPSASAGWVLSEEKFMKNTRSWLDFLKIRASWGLNGNQSIANFQYVSPVAFDLSHSYQFVGSHAIYRALWSQQAHCQGLFLSDRGAFPFRTEQSVNLQADKDRQA